MSKDYLDKWEERAKKNTEIIEQHQTNRDMKKFSDLEFKDHKHIKGAVQAYIEFENGQWISVIGGDHFYGNGSTSFEIMSSSTENRAGGVKGWRSKQQITDHMRYLQRK